MSYIFILTFVTRQKVNYTTLIISKALKLQVCLLWLLSFGALLVVQGNQAWNCDGMSCGWCISCNVLCNMLEPDDSHGESDNDEVDNSSNDDRRQDSRLQE